MEGKVETGLFRSYNSTQPADRRQTNEISDNRHADCRHGLAKLMPLANHRQPALHLFGESPVLLLRDSRVVLADKYRGARWHLHRLDLASAHLLIERIAGPMRSEMHMQMRYASAKYVDVD